jgi:hypothetical protein
MKGVAMTSRKRVFDTLNFELPVGECIPRQMWVLPWADEHFPGVKEKLQKQFPDDIAHAPGCYSSPVNERIVGGMFSVGTFIDEWGCIFENKQSGIIGEHCSPISS